jgi:hypothetical protein
MVRYVPEVARYTKIHAKCTILISGKLRYPANLGYGCARYRRFYCSYSHLFCVTEYVAPNCQVLCSKNVCSAEGKILETK